MAFEKALLANKAPGCKAFKKARQGRPSITRSDLEVAVTGTTINELLPFHTKHAVMQVSTKAEKGQFPPPQGQVNQNESLRLKCDKV